MGFYLLVLVDSLFIDQLVFTIAFIMWDILEKNFFNLIYLKKKVISL